MYFVIFKILRYNFDSIPNGGFNRTLIDLIFIDIADIYGTLMNGRLNQFPTLMR